MTYEEWKKGFEEKCSVAKNSFVEVYEYIEKLDEVTDDDNANDLEEFMTIELMKVFMQVQKIAEKCGV
jgi:hypothetical protein